MTKVSKLKWAFASLLLIWLGLMLAWQWHARACAQERGRFDVMAWECIPLTPPIILERGIRRS